MSVTINAHQLGRLIDKTSAHMGSEYVEPLHGIRLDVDAKHLYAVATDRYTLAVARYQLNHGDLAQEPWARTIPAEHLRSLREWIDTMKGAGLITISTAKDRLVFEGPQTDLSIAVSLSLEFPDWRGLLRKTAGQASDGDLFPALSAHHLSRFNNGDTIRARLAANDKPALVFSEDFIGALMPAQYAGIYPCKEESFEGAHRSWLWTLAAGGADADMESSIAYEEDRPRYEATTDIRETAESLLHEVLRSTTDCHHTNHDTENDLWMAHIRIGVANWMAFRYLDALHNADPRVAAEVVADVAGQLDSGEISEWAWDEAKAAGFDPQKWDDEYGAHLKKQAEERAKTEAAQFGCRLASALNAAKAAGINFRVEPNEHVGYDEVLEEWNPAMGVKPADTTA